MKFKRIKTAFLAVLFTTSLPAFAAEAESCVPSWCKAPNAKLKPSEQSICRYPELQTADHLLNLVYQQYRNALQGEAQKKLTAAQSQWRTQERDTLTGKQELLAAILERVQEINFMSSMVNNP